MLTGEYTYKNTKYLPKSLNYVTLNDLVEFESTPRPIKSIKFNNSRQEIDTYQLYFSSPPNCYHYIKPGGTIIKTDKELIQSKNIEITYSDDKISYGKFDDNYTEGVLCDTSVLAVYSIKSWNRQYFIVYSDLTCHHIQHGSGMHYVEFNEGVIQKSDYSSQDDNITGWSLENFLKFFSNKY